MTTVGWTGPSGGWVTLGLVLAPPAAPPGTSAVPVAGSTMPQVPKLDPTLYSLRHIRVGNPLDPTGTFAMGALANASTVTVLGQSTSFLELPISELIASPDLVSGTDTTRLNDSGTWQIQVPNKIASDGIGWKDRFTNFGRADWVEIRRGGYVEFVGCVESIIPDYQSVTVSGHDGMWMLKNSYERDWQCLQAPRDVMAHASCLPVPQLIDPFSEGAVNLGLWSTISVNGGAVSINSPAGSGLKLAVTSAGGSEAGLQSVASFTLSAGTKWSLSLNINAINLGTASFQVDISGSVLGMRGPAGAPVAQVTQGVLGAVPVGSLNATSTLVLECDGRWVRGYVNGQLVGYMANLVAPGTVNFTLNGVGAAATVYIANYVFEEWKPFLMAGSDQGDYVLPGTAQTYPTGGLHARYYNDVALGGLSAANQLTQALNPAKDNPASGQPAPYDVIETTLSGTQSPGSHVTSGFAATGWSAKYFGAIWLPLSGGNIPMDLFLQTGTTAARVWIGATQFGQQIVDQWATFVASGAQNFAVTAAALGGVDAWYPIIIEVAVGTATTAPALYFGYPGAPLTFDWTDPGGTTYTAGSTGTLVATTSLSPLGCIDQRYQGVSYFDMYQQAGNAFGYQFTCEPQQLESGVFPGVLAPRLREGRDTDEVLEADTTDGVAPVLNYKNQLDATDQCSSMYGIGAGINDGQGSQLQAQVFDLATLQNCLFDMQGWIDASDVSYISLLAQRVASQLALQAQPWQNLTGDPRGIDRLADTFPLSGHLSEFHWRPGDGVRFYLPDVNVIDAVPRQMTQVTRMFGSTGRTSSSMVPGIAGNLLRRRV